MNIADDVAKWVVQDRHLSALVTLNVKNALNWVPWNFVDAAMAGFGVTHYLRRIVWFYLTERTIILSSERA